MKNKIVPLAGIVGLASCLPLAAATAPDDAFGKLPLAQSIRTQIGPGSRAIVVFEDAYCPYCRHLHQSLAQSHDLVVLTFMLGALNPDSGAKADSIWCATERSKALNQWFAAHEAEPAKPGCHAPLDQINRLAESLGVRATPTILFADGSVAAGAISIREIHRRIDAAQRAASSK